MTKLEKLYASIKNLQELGYPISEEDQKKLDEMEEQIIKNEILPSLTENIEPMLSQIERELVLVVEHKPGQPLSVRLSRKMNIAKALEAKKIESTNNTPSASTSVVNAVVTSNNSSQTSSRHITRAPRTGLCIFLPDGDFIQESKASETMVEAIRRAGAKRAMEVNIPHDGKNLVTSVNSGWSPHASVHVVERGVYVDTHSSTATKKTQLEKLFKALDLKWKVKVVK